MTTDIHNITNFKMALLKMGYRQPNATMDANRWAKPFGFVVYIAHLKELKINSHFYAKDGELHCWKMHDVELNNPNNPLELQIANIEQYDECNGYYGPTHFGFMTLEQRGEMILGT